MSCCSQHQGCHGERLLLRFNFDVLQKEVQVAQKHLQCLTGHAFIDTKGSKVSEEVLFVVSLVKMVYGGPKSCLPSFFLFQGESVNEMSLEGEPFLDGHVGVVSLHGSV